MQHGNNSSPEPFGAISERPGDGAGTLIDKVGQQTDDAERDTEPPGTHSQRSFPCHCHAPSIFIASDRQGTGVYSGTFDQEGHQREGHEDGQDQTRALVSQEDRQETDDDRAGCVARIAKTP